MKHDTSRYVAEDYYADVYTSFMRRYADALYTGRTRQHILDVGCGTGRFAVELAALGHEVTGVDYMPDKIEKARRRASSRGVSIDLRRGEAERVLEQLSGERYDTILCFEMLSVASGYREIMREMRRLLAPQGILFCTHRPRYYFITTLLQGGDYKSALRVARSNEGIIALNNKPVYYNWHTKEEIEALYRDLGLNVLGVHPIGMFSGFGVDGMAKIADPETMSDRARRTLFQLETEDLEDYVAIGRYLLAVSTRQS